MLGGMLCQVNGALRIGFPHHPCRSRGAERYRADDRTCPWVMSDGQTRTLCPEVSGCTETPLHSL